MIPDATITKALQSGVKTWDFRYDIIGQDGAVLRQANVSRCSVTNNDLADIKRTCKVDVESPVQTGAVGNTPVFNQLTERLRPWARLLMDGDTAISELLTGNNSTFEGGIGEWKNNNLLNARDNVASVAQTTLLAHSGTKSLLVTFVSSIKGQFVTCVVPTTPGVSYTASAWVYVPTGSPSARLSAAFVAGGTVTGTLKDQWVRLTCQWVADSTGRTFLGVDVAPNTDAGDVVYIDDVTCRADKGSIPDYYQEFPMGTFYLESGSMRRQSAAGERSVPFEGYDGLIVLREDKVTDRYVVTSGTNYITAIETVLTSAGFTVNTITGSTASLPAPMEWEPGTPKLQIINELLAAINFTPITMDPMGVPTSTLYQDPESSSVLWDYTIDANSVVMPNIETALDLFNVPNVWVGVVSQPDRAPLRSVYTNDDPGSFTSTVSRGRNIVAVLTEEVKDAVDQATLDALVIRHAKEASQKFEEAKFSTGLMPIHETGDVVQLDYGDGLLRFRETEWSVELRAGADMKHTCRRTVFI